MKKLIIFLIICMSSTAVLAQDTIRTRHWTPIHAGDIALTMTATSILQIDGVEQKNPNLEVGVFCVSNGECRGAKLPKYKANTDQYFYLLMIFGEQGEEYTFKVYDHETGQELTLTPPATITHEANGRLGRLKSPFVLNFTSE